MVCLAEATEADQVGIPQMAPAWRLGLPCAMPPMLMRWILALAVAVVSVPVLAQAPAPGDLVVNEIMYDPPAPQPSGNEWVEVLNVSGRTLDVSGLAVSDGGTPSAGVPAGTTLADGAFLVLVDNGVAFAAAYPGVAFVELAGFPALNNTGDRPALLINGAEIDAVPYRPSWGGSDASLERRDPLGPSTAAANFGTTTDPQFGTPGEQNSLFAPDVTGPALVSAQASADGRTVTVTVGEPLDPASVTPGAFSVTGSPAVTAAAYDGDALTVTLTLSAALDLGTSTVTATGLRDARGNSTATTATTVEYDPDVAAPTLVSAVALDAQSVRLTFSEALDPASAEMEANYSVSDGIGAPVMADLQPDPTQVVLALATPLTGPARYTITVQNVADVAGNAIETATATLFFGDGAVPAPRDLVINEFLYDEPTSDNPGEFVELYNRSDQTFDLSEFTLNDNTGSDEPISNEPVFIGPGEYAVVVEDAEAFAAQFPGVSFVDQPSWSALNNSGDSVVLRYQGVRIDSLRYTPAWGGEDASLERKDPEGPSGRANFATTTDPRGGTPGAQNSQFAPDLTGPVLVEARVRADGRGILLTVDEPLDPASVTPAAFTIDGGPAVSAVAYEPGTVTVVIGFEPGQALAPGSVTVTATGLRDEIGNTTPSTSVTAVLDADGTPPAILRAVAQSATVVRVTFSEGVTFGTGAGASRYSIDGGIGTAASAEVVEAVDNVGSVAGVRVVDITFPEPLQERTLYTLTARVTDLAGNDADATARVFFGTADTPQAGEVVLTEILYDPANGSDGEYIEVLNTTADRVFDLSAITLDDGDGDGDPLADVTEVLLPSEYLALVRDGDGFRQAFPEAAFVEVGSVVGLSNSGEAVVLRAGAAVLDSVFYDPDWHRVELEDATGIALERRDPAGGSNDPANWSSSLAALGGTPSAENSLSVSGTPVERETALTITSPFAPTRGEAAEITYTLSTEAGLVRARIYDGGGRLVRQLDAGRLSGQTATLVWDGTGDDRRPQRAGIYVVLIEAVDAQGGTTDALRGAVVLARPE